MKKWENGCHIMETCHTEKFSITDPTPQSLGLCFSNVDGNGTLASAIMKKNGCHVMETCHTAKFPITDPKKFVSLLFRVLTQMENWHWALWKNGKWLPIHGTCCTENFQLRKVIINLECWNWIKVFSLPHESPMCNFTLPDISCSLCRLRLSNSV